MTLEQDIEIIDLPDSGEFKVVQLFVDNKPVMICNSSDFHYKMLGNYLDSNKISHDLEMFGRWELPALKGERYEVVGMGEAHIIQRSKFFQLPYGKSHDYKIKTNPEFRDKLKEQFTGWTF